MDIHISNTFTQIQNHIPPVMQALRQPGDDPSVDNHAEAVKYSTDSGIIYRSFGFWGQGIPTDKHWFLAWGIRLPGGAFKDDLPDEAGQLPHAFLELGEYGDGANDRLPLERLADFPIGEWRAVLNDTELLLATPLNEFPDDPQLIGALENWVAQGMASALPIIRRLRGIE